MEKWQGLFWAPALGDIQVAACLSPISTPSLAGFWGNKHLFLYVTCLPLVMALGASAIYQPKQQ